MEHYCLRDLQFNSKIANDNLVVECNMVKK